MKKLDQLTFNNTFRELPADFYTAMSPSPLTKPRLVAFNEDAAKLIDLDPKEASSENFIKYFGGETLFSGSDPLAAVYSGHQFGGYSPRLGDGRAILLGEIKNKAGDNWDVQLKGSGLTPYSRMGDGRAVLRSSIREYLCSEAMHHLGIATTRALCIIGSEEPIRRETIETGAVVTRLAKSHVRFGSFEYFYHTQQHDLLRTLADYVIEHHYPECKDSDDPYADFFQQVVNRTAKLMAQWQTVGFCHGVMNTDNMSILGDTFDYGPYGFLDAFDPNHICNHSDHQGRYAYDRQPGIALWNCSCLAQALLPLTEKDKLVEILDGYEDSLMKNYSSIMQNKLGLSRIIDGDKDLSGNLLGIMAHSKVDYTLFFRRLSDFKTNNSKVKDDNDLLRDMFIDRDSFDAWAETYNARLQKNDNSAEDRKKIMDRVNPKYILRNHLAQTAIEKAEQQQDYSEIENLLRCLQKPFDEQPEFEHYADLPPDWANGLEVSCSS